jgi:hypothetical protein
MADYKSRKKALSAHYNESIRFQPLLEALIGAEDPVAVIFMLMLKSAMQVGWMCHYGKRMKVGVKDKKTKGICLNQNCRIMRALIGCSFAEALQITDSKVLDILACWCPDFPIRTASTSKWIQRPDYLAPN